MLDRLEAVSADITTLKIDAIVNAANARLVPGGGVDGAIRRAGGPTLNKKLAEIGGCETGMAVITDGYALPARYVIHTVGPVWDNREKPTELDKVLARCYRACLGLADEKAIRTIAFPSISTGVYGYPIDRAAGVAIAACLAHLEAGGTQDKITFCCFSPSDFAIYRRRLAALGA
jgi:O-acetyl-ADP-ribose deacetylase